MKDFKSLRQKIDTIDAAIIKKLAQRQRLSKKIGQLKTTLRKSIKDLPREKAQKQQYKELCAHYQLELRFINQLFKLIISHSRNIQKNDFPN